MIYTFIKTAGVWIDVGFSISSLSGSDFHLHIPETASLVSCSVDHTLIYGLIMGITEFRTTV